LIFSHLCETVTAINRPVGLGFEGYFRFVSARRANRRKIFPRAASGALTRVTAIFAALGLVLEAALGVELLLACREDKLRSTFLTYQGLVFVHVETSLLTKNLSLLQVLFAFSFH